MRIISILALCPTLALASIGIDIVSVDPDQKEPQGFGVTITPESPYLRIKVEYPPTIKSALRPKFAIVAYWAEPGEIRFVVRTELDLAENKPLEFTLTKKPEIADASVDFHYVCTSDDQDICIKDQEIKFHIKSIRAYLSTE